MGVPGYAGAVYNGLALILFVGRRSCFSFRRYKTSLKTTLEGCQRHCEAMFFDLIGWEGSAVPFEGPRSEHAASFILIVLEHLMGRLFALALACLSFRRQNQDIHVALN